jgi:hypothetical protein
VNKDISIKSLYPFAATPGKNRIGRLAFGGRIGMHFSCYYWEH